MRIICKCGKEFNACNSLLLQGKGKYCSKICMYKYRTRPKGLKYKIVKINPTWIKKGQHLSYKTEFVKGSKPFNYGKGKGYININGYKVISINGKEILEHRYLIQKKLNRKLNFNNIVHHINQNRLDNKIENLKLLSRAKHTKLHHEIRRKKCQKYV
jgi:hypothetical protein